MGLLVEGVWHDKWYDTKGNQGAFKREAAKLRNWITPDGKAGASGKAGFKAEPGRYHLYVSLACPWAHRVLIFRHLKGLENLIDVSIVSTDMLGSGWSFDQQTGSDGDALFGSEFLHQVYTRHDPNYSGRVTVPLLWDKNNQCIVSNESSEIIRMFNSAFDHLTNNTLDFYPLALRAEIDAINEQVYQKVNNGVYRCGFATSQSAYEEAFSQLFDMLAKLDDRLASQRYLVGDSLTEADWRLFTTLIRFDAVYFGHFKCNFKQIMQFNNLQEYTCDLYQHAQVAKTVNFEHIKRHYYFSHDNINPTQVIPKGPKLDFMARNKREQL